MELLVGRGACRIPKGWEKSQNRIQVARAKGEGVKAAVVNQVILEGTNQIGMGVYLFYSCQGQGVICWGGIDTCSWVWGCFQGERKWQSDCPKDEKQIEEVFGAKPGNRGKLNISP